MSSQSPGARFAPIRPAPRRSPARTTEGERTRGRLAAAKLNGGAQVVTPRGHDRYTVEGRAGGRYTVQAFNLETLYCDCKSGFYRGPNSCWHAAAVYLRLIADRALTARNAA